MTKPCRWRGTHKTFGGAGGTPTSSTPSPALGATFKKSLGWVKKERKIQIMSRFEKKSPLYLLLQLLTFGRFGMGPLGGLNTTTLPNISPVIALHGAHPAIHTQFSVACLNYGGIAFWEWVFYSPWCGRRLQGKSRFPVQQIRHLERPPGNHPWRVKKKIKK